MQLIEHLSGFSVDDLRELARRRGVLLRQEALRDRQTLLRNLSSALGSYEGLHIALSGMNQAELAVLGELLRSRKRSSLGTLAAALKADPPAVRAALDSIRLWGLAFPEGSWDHIGIPASTQALAPYFDTSWGGAAVPFTPTPRLAAAPLDGLEGRPGSLSWDLAEFLARVARSRFKLTQARRINKRDLRSIEPALAFPAPAYSSFLYLLVLGAGLVIESRDGVMGVSEDADVLLGQGPAERTRILTSAWLQLRGFPECSVAEPEETDYVPFHILRQREVVTQLLAGLGDGEGVTVASLSDALRWHLPRSFSQWEGHPDPHLVTRRLVRSMFWLGLVRVDDPEKPDRVAWTPLGSLILAQRSGPSAVIPEEPHFFLQPNAETFCPPNISPRTLFHLRRITGEKKGGPAGMFPINQDTLRRALDLGSSAEEVTRFLETFSRTGVPDTVKKLVETVGRQHGRIRLIPAEVVLVTDDPKLLEELRNLKPLQPILGRPLTERSVSLDAAHAGEVLKRLRSRGYSPVDESLTSEAPPLPDGLQAPELPQVSLTPDELVPPGFLDWSSVSADPEPLQAPGEQAPVWGRADVVDLLERAAEESLEVEIEYVTRGRSKPTVRRICPLWVDDYHVEGYCRLREDDRIFNLSGIRWARLTGETFDFERL